MLQSLWPEQESVQKTCTTSSMPGVLEVHSSAGAWQASPMRYRNQGLSMSSDAHADEYSRYVVDGAAVAEMKGIIERHQAK
ncbi:copper homeostasis protein [Escherichia coli]|nr:copper homeostasis protein [Escherichia coli]